MMSTGTLFLSRKTKPQAMRAKDGEFALTLLAFWTLRANELQPGVALTVELTRLRAFSATGKHSSAEINACVNSLQLRPTAANFQDKTTSSPCESNAGSY